MSPETNDTSANTTRARIIRFVAALAIVLTLFAAIEILPLHFGPRQVPWDQLWPIVGEKLPRFVLIALAVAGVLAFGRRREHRDR
ncbi:MAG: hypothetical protein GF331_22515 [Chitinivibrionales bacterium]|nr:hypothetical protein [Chitinivibrionales bacterium]